MGRTTRPDVHAGDATGMWEGREGKQDTVSLTTSTSMWSFWRAHVPSSCRPTPDFWAEDMGQWATKVGTTVLVLLLGAGQRCSVGRRGVGGSVSVLRARCHQGGLAPGRERWTGLGDELEMNE